MTSRNRQIVLAARPKGLPNESDFRLVEASLPAPEKGEFLVQALYLSLDPYIRGRMNDVESYVPALQIGEVIASGVVGRVVQSHHPGFAEGEIVQGMFGWQEYALSNGQGVLKVDAAVAPVSTALGILGMPGMTAYFGLLEVGQPKAGETVVVSGAAGAVGSVVGQIARLQGCRCIGTTGSDAKVRYLVDELGFDAAFNYKTTADYSARLRALCPNGIDVYFDNVGGAITDAVLPLINNGARLVICGQSSQYNLEKPDTGPRWLWQLIVHQARAEGFLVFKFSARFPEAVTRMAQWLREGKLKYRETTAEGIENTPRAFIGMLQGANIGKQLVRVAK